MRALKLVAWGLALVVAACGKSNAPAPAGGNGAPPAPTGPAVSGMILADQPATLAAGANLTVRLLDITRAEGDAIVVTTQTTPISSVPAEFRLPYISGEINPIRTYAVDATVMDQGVVRYVSQGRVGVLTQGKPARASIMMAQALSNVVKDPVAEFNKEFAEFETRLGGLKRFTGNSISGPEGKEVATGWDAFADDTGVRMVREMVSNSADGSRINRRFAFKDGKPWVAIREAGGTTIKLGWNPDGTVLVAEKNGAADESVKEESDDLRKQARNSREVAEAQNH